MDIPSDVEKFLQETGLTELKETFKKEELSLDNILNLTHEYLKEIGIKKLDQRIKILKNIEEFKTKSVNVDSVATQVQKVNITGTKSNDGRWETAATLTLSSEGPVADWWGNCLGVFDLLPGLTNQAVAYRQRHTVSGEGKYLYKATEWNWFVGTILGENSGGLMNQSASNQVPRWGWKFGKEKGWHPATLSISTSPPSLCSTINITDTVSLGTFTATQDWSAGRQVFRNTNSGHVLCIQPGQVNWGVRATPESVDASIESCRAPSLCPAYERAARSERSGNTGWQYSSTERSGRISVKCDKCYRRF